MRPGVAAPAAGRAGLVRFARASRRFVGAMVGRIAEDHLGVIAAGVAFYSLLGVFPALAALVALYGLLLDPAQIGEQLAALSGVLPGDALALLVGKLDELNRVRRGTVGLGAAAALALAWWSASAAVRALMQALNLAYDVHEGRGLLHRTALSLLLTLCAIVGGIVAVAAVVVLPALLELLHLQPILRGLMDYARWPVLAAMVWLGLLVLYRFGPDLPAARWSWRDRGAVLAVLLWLAGSALFSEYVRRFAHYDATYGSIGGVVILMMWFLLSGWAVLLGAELDAELAARAEARNARPAAAVSSPPSVRAATRGRARHARCATPSRSS